MRLVLLLLLGVVGVSVPAMAELQAFPPTAPGTNEVKTLPAGVLLRTTGNGNYFERSGALFMPLFRYIERHDIAMTVPVEARIDDAAMYFWVAESEVAKVAGDQGPVVVERRPARRVASHGVRGSYSQANFTAARDRLLAWLTTRPDLVPAGEPYAVFWNGPFTPGFLRRFEVHVPVRETAAPTGS